MVMPHEFYNPEWQDEVALIPENEAGSAHCWHCGNVSGHSSHIGMGPDELRGWRERESSERGGTFALGPPAVLRA